jgi:hypothetical protein
MLDWALCSSAIDVETALAVAMSFVEWKHRSLRAHSDFQLL